MMSDGPHGTQFLSLDALSTYIFASQHSPPDSFFFILSITSHRHAECRIGIQVPIQMCALCHSE